MGVTDEYQTSDMYKFPRNLDNVQLIKTEKGTFPILHSVPCDELKIASIDWVTFSFGVETLGTQYLHISSEYEEDGLTWAIEHLLEPWLYEIFGFGLGKRRKNGMIHHKFAYELQEHDGSSLGMVLYGHNSKKITVQINGTGCALAVRGWEKTLYQYILNDFQRAELRRIDLAHDDLQGDYLSVDLADEWDSNGGFYCGGKMPNIEHKGSWKRINGRGRTLNIGHRESGKYCRIYEKGKKEGDALSLWTRAEVEFKATDRYIPLDILLCPSPYFVGAYPCFQWLAKTLKGQFINAEKTEIIKKQGEINLEKSIEITKHQFGKYIRFYRKIFSDEQIVEMLSSEKDEVPSRLKFAMTSAIMLAKQNISLATQKIDDLPLFQHVTAINQSIYERSISKC
ncbi:replication protein [Acinetobacter qingfengensis]|uniref:Replication protein n=2 Tax=Acinetobacter qingfengensis TaxID=1262585 RepID=A0A1E7QZ78_9GAMM|nr:replication protein [Acinetobacter qingfengensis]